MFVSFSFQLNVEFLKVVVTLFDMVNINVHVMNNWSLCTCLYIRLTCHSLHMIIEMRSVCAWAVQNCFCILSIKWNWWNEEGENFVSTWIQLKHPLQGIQGGHFYSLVSMCIESNLKYVILKIWEKVFLNQFVKVQYDMRDISSCEILV